MEERKVSRLDHSHIEDSNGSELEPRHSSVPYRRRVPRSNTGELSRSLLLHGILQSETNTEANEWAVNSDPPLQGSQYASSSNLATEQTSNNEMQNSSQQVAMAKSADNQTLKTRNTGSHTTRSQSLKTGDTLQMVSNVIHRHIALCEQRRKSRYLRETGDIDGLKYASSNSVMAEARFVKPRWQYHFLRSPHLRLQSRFVVKKMKHEDQQPSTSEIFTFLKTLFQKAKLSGECSIVCLIYMERLMDTAQIELLSSNWRPIVLCGLLLASKVWQDHSSWNIEFACIYPHYSLQSINRLEREFIEHLEWDLYISSNLYAKYYFALSSLNKPNHDRAPMVKYPPPVASQLVEVRSASMRHSLHSQSVIRALALDNESRDASSGAQQRQTDNDSSLILHEPR